MSSSNNIAHPAPLNQEKKYLDPKHFMDTSPSKAGGPDELLHITFQHLNLSIRKMIPVNNLFKCMLRCHLSERPWNSVA